MKKKKDPRMNDIAFFFLVAVISVSLSVYVQEVNVLTRDNVAQVVGAVATGTVTTPVTATLITPNPVFADYVLLKNCLLETKTAGGVCSLTDFNNDGLTNFGDLALAKAVGVSTSSSRYDLNGDGTANYVDLTSGATTPVSDMSLFKSCFFKSQNLNGVCALSDFNGDKVINFADLALLKANNLSTDLAVVNKYDLNSDGKVNYADDVDLAEPANLGLTDFNLLKYCFFAKTLGVCSLADLNNDGAINFGDLALAKTKTGATDTASVERYDLNGDGKVGYVDSTLLATSTVTDLNLLKSCFFKQAPLTGVCAISDFNDDGLINFADLAALKQAVSSSNFLQIQKYDLNGDGKIVSFSDPYAPTGTLYAGVDTSDPAFVGNKNITVPARQVKVAKFKFTGIGSDFVVQDLKLKIPNDVSTSTENITIKYKDMYGELKTISNVLVLPDSKQPYATSTFTNLQLLVPKDGVGFLEVYANFSDFSVGAKASTVFKVILDHLNSFKAVDSNGNVFRSVGTSDVLGAGSVTVTFPSTGGSSLPANPASNDTYPAVSVSVSPNTIIVGQSVTLSATASDDKGVAGVQFKVNGVDQGSEDTTSPYTFSYTQSSPGIYTVTAVARDTLGQKTTSNSVSLTVSSAPAPTTPGGK